LLKKINKVWLTPYFNPTTANYYLLSSYLLANGYKYLKNMFELAKEADSVLLKALIPFFLDFSERQNSKD